MFTHPPNLSVQTLGQDDLELVFVGLFDKALFGNGIQNGNTIAHFMNKIFGDGFVDRYDIFFFVVVSGAEYFVDNVTIVGQKN
jgi:hypothetical protein